MCGHMGSGGGTLDLEGLQAGVCCHSVLRKGVPVSNAMAQWLKNFIFL